MTSQTRKKIAIDIDDVVAMTSEAVREWANEKAGMTLGAHDYFLTEADYWNYYEAVWEKHGVASLSLEDFLETMDASQGHIRAMEDARRVIRALKSEYDLVFMTARRPAHKDSTRVWLDEFIDSSVPLYLSHNPFANEVAQSKGELCAELGIDMLIDDNVDNCHSALQYGVDAIVFGNYGWNVDVPDGVVRCQSWSQVEEYLRDQT